MNKDRPEAIKSDEIDYSVVTTPFLSYLDDIKNGFNPFTHEKSLKRSSETCDLFIKMKKNAEVGEIVDDSKLKLEYEKIMAVEGSIGDWQRAEEAFKFYDESVRRNRAGLVGEHSFYEGLRECYHELLIKKAPAEIAAKYQDFLPNSLVRWYRYLLEK